MSPEQLLNARIASYRSSYRSVIFSTAEGTMIQFMGSEPKPLRTPVQNSDVYLDWVHKYFLPFAAELKKPWVLVHGDVFVSRSMDSLGLDVETLREQGLLVFMHEPLFAYSEQGAWPWFKNKGAPKFPELEAISNYARDEKLAGKITVCLCENGLSVELHRRGLFQNLNFVDFSTYTLYEAQTGAQEVRPDSSESMIEKKLLSLNFRYEAIRETLVAYLMGSEDRDDNFVSFFHGHNREEYLNRLPFDPQTLPFWPRVEKGIQVLQAQLPLTLDTGKPRIADPLAESVPDFLGDNQKNSFHLDSEFSRYAFAFCYCESRPFAWRSEISEKTFHPIFMRKPFLPYAAPYFLENLRNLGFKTFGDYWDESFDTIEDDAERFIKFIAAVDSILGRDMETLNKWTQKLRPIVEHNHRLLTADYAPSLITNFKKAAKRL